MIDTTRTGIAIMVLALAIFAIQDGISRHLAGTYNVWMVVMIRYWVFAAFVLMLALRRGGIKKAAQTNQPWLQISRGLLLALEVCVGILAFTLIGLIETIVIFSAFPLIVAALSGPMLGEAVGWRRWVAIFVGFIGILVILQPGYGVFAPAALLALLSSVMFAVYSLLTRLVARQDSAETSIFYTGVFGALITTAIGIWFIEPMSPSDMLWMGTLSLTSLVGHALLIKAYTLAEASALAPFNFLHMVFVTGIGITIFGEVLEMNVVIGSIIIVGAGLFTIFRSKRANQEPP